MGFGREVEVGGVGGSGRTAGACFIGVEGGEGVAGTVEVSRELMLVLEADSVGVSGALEGGDEQKDGVPGTIEVSDNEMLLGS